MHCSEMQWKYRTRFKIRILPRAVMYLVAFSLIYFSMRNIRHYLEINHKSTHYKPEIYVKAAIQQIITNTSSSSVNEQTVTSTKHCDIFFLCLRELSELQGEPKRGENPIIFLETSCVLGDNSVNSSNRGLILKPRSACAIESAARTNPKRYVYVIYSCPIVGEIQDSSLHVRYMLNYTNVKIWFLGVNEYLKKTPLENWDFYKKMNTSKWPNSHASDVLRYISLWKYGGTYLDMDFVIIRSLEDLGSNFVGAQAETYLASGALDFATEGIGQVVANLCVRELQSNFRGDIWGRNGPGVITKVLGNLCGTKQVRNMTRKECLGFQVYPPNIFYKIHYTRYKKFFDEKNKNETISSLKGSYGVHLWNKLSVDRKVTVGSNQPYGLLASEYCPGVYNNIGPIF